MTNVVVNVLKEVTVKEELVTIALQGRHLEFDVTKRKHFNELNSHKPNFRIVKILFLLK